MTDKGVASGSEIFHEACMPDEYQSGTEGEPHPKGILPLGPTHCQRVESSSLIFPQRVLERLGYITVGEKL